MKIKHFFLSLILAMPAISCFAAYNGYDIWIQNATGGVLSEASFTVGTETMMFFPNGYDISPSTPNTFSLFATLQSNKHKPPTGTVTLKDGACVITVSQNYRKIEVHSTSSQYTCEIAPYGISSWDTQIIIKKR